jgi:hypothetical protein
MNWSVSLSFTLRSILLPQIVVYFRIRLRRTRQHDCGIRYFTVGWLPYCLWIKPTDIHNSSRSFELQACVLLKNILIIRIGTNIRKLERVFGVPFLLDVLTVGSEPDMLTFLLEFIRWIHSCVNVMEKSLSHFCTTCATEAANVVQLGQTSRI